MRISDPLSRPMAGLLAVLLLVMPLSGCLQPGYSAAEREWERKRSTEPFAVLSAQPRRAVISARGQLIAIAPAGGFCVSESSIEVLRRAVFALLSDCAVEAVAASAKRSARGELQLPKAPPAIVTVSVSGDAMFRDGKSRTRTLDDLARFLETEQGLEMLGRGSGRATVSVRQSRQEGDTLYVLVRDKDKQTLPLLVPDFWRAFVEINDRLVVVTVSGFRDIPLSEGEMLKHLREQVSALRAANRTPPRPDETRVASVVRKKPKSFPESLRTASAVTVEGGSTAYNPLREVQGLSVFIAPARDGTPEILPVPGVKPQPKPDRDTVASGSRYAPRKSPIAPAKPG